RSALDGGVLVPGVRGFHRSDADVSAVEHRRRDGDAAARAPRRDPRLHLGEIAMFGNFDFDVIRRSLPYLFYEGMTFTIMLTALAATGGLVVGTAIALMRLSGYRP